MSFAINETEKRGVKGSG